ncbi:MAG: hypothetical protein EPN97_06730 [Alphaproteobacteria bacterium]|nr:MAG: hypothetical protein EPN97_06730 [Alphaproteobacteria bacterium]
MTDFDASSFVRRIQRAEKAADVDTAFSEITALKPAEQKKAIDAVETLCVSHWQSNAAAGIGMLKSVVADIDAVKGTPREAFMVAQLNSMMPAEEGKIMTAAFTNIHKIKGDKSAPLVRAYAQEVAKLPAADFDTTLGQLKLVMSVDAALQAGLPEAAPAKKPIKGPRPPRRRGGPKHH